MKAICCLSLLTNIDDSKQREPALASATKGVAEMSFCIKNPPSLTVWVWLFAVDEAL